MRSGKGRIRALVRRGTRSDRKPPVATKAAPLRQPTVCERCGAVFSRQTWRRGRKLTHALLQRAGWTVCPACRQASRGEYFGRVVIGGAFAAAHELALRARIRNVAARARFTQPERQLRTPSSAPATCPRCSPPRRSSPTGSSTS